MNDVPQPITPEGKKAVWLATLAVLVAQLPINLVSVSLTTIAADTGTGTAGLQWIQSIFILAMSAAVLSAGVIAENIGRRRVMVIALWLMASGTTLGWLSPLFGDWTMPVLWTGQAIAGLGGGALLPTTLATITAAVPDYRQRGPYIALWGAGTTAGLTLGAIVGGLINEIAHWGWVYLPAVIVAALIAVITQTQLPAAPTSAPGMDAQGQIYATLAIVGVIFGVIQGGSTGWLSPSALTGYAVFAVFLTLFIYRESHTYAPLMDIRIFANTRFAAAGFAAAMSLFSVVGMGFMLALFLGTAKERTPLGIASSLAFMPGTALAASPLAGALLKRTRPTWVLILGLGLAALGTFLLAGADAETSYPAMLWRIMVFGVSISLMLSSVTTVAVNAVPPRQAAMAGATNTVLRQVGGALGPAILGSVWATVLNEGGAVSEAFSTAVGVTTGLLVLAALLCLLAEFAGGKKAAGSM